MQHAHPPSPAALGHLRARDASGLAFTALAVAATSTGLWLSRGGFMAWVPGQLLLALAMVEWFVLLHECGHRTLFSTRVGNAIVGHLAGFFAAIPYDAWVHVHRQHHRWTGWQDLDPTTATLAPRHRSAVVLLIVRVCWRFWIPLFSIVYRLGNFWAAPRIVRSYLSGQVPGRVIAGLLAVAAVYAGLAWRVGLFEIARLAGLATLLAFIAEDVLLISQHTHVPMDQSGGQHVMPHRALDQERYTRSLRLPDPLSRLALHFDAHELHHMYPFVPGYRLREIDYEPANEVNWWRWVRSARAFPGDVLLFRNRRETGFPL